ncbi:MAG: FAD/NAD(P)-binding protein [Polyangiaceae bacterium]|nr:FAD/NAD(P)-binding protein [Polyangiaceae bacterium]
MQAEKESTRTVDWLIVGGGIHGVYLAGRLVADIAVAPEQIAIVDPAESLLSRWKSLTATTGMTHLRSPSVHHLDEDPFSLLRFAKGKKKPKVKLFAYPNDRPALRLFNAHCEHVMDSLGLHSMHIRDRALRASVNCDSVRVELAEQGQIRAHNVILALGASEQPFWPEWAPRNSDRVHHIFSPDSSNWPNRKESIALVGGGISAAQVALRLVDEGHEVSLISRHSLRKHQFDSDPGWLGPKYMNHFRRQKNYDCRRELIVEARHKGSVPPDVYLQLRKTIADSRINWHQGFVRELHVDNHGLALHLSEGRDLKVDRVMLATGFCPQRPGGELVDSLIASASLPCASCGYPIVDSALRWHPRVRVAGPLAELELGPVARNIVGARRAGERLMASVNRVAS